MDSKQTPTFTMREFLRSPKRASAILRTGTQIAVTSNGKPLFTAIPASTNTARLTGKDFAHLVMRHDHSSDLSQRVDEIVYGI